MTSGEKLMTAIREFNEEMGRQSAEQSVRFNAILLNDERNYCRERNVCFVCGFPFTAVSNPIIGASGLRIHDDCVEQSR